MPIRSHPDRGVLLTCDFNEGFRKPEMVKRRPVVVLTPKIRARPALATVVALSTTPPQKEMPYHCMIEIPFSRLPSFFAKKMWVKGDMVMAVGFHRLDLVRLGKDTLGNRQYLTEPLSDDEFRKVQKCVLHGLGFSHLTKHA